MNADLAVRDLDLLGERAEMISAVAAAIDPDALARRPCERPDHLWGDGLLQRGLQQRAGTRGVGLRLVRIAFRLVTRSFSAGSSRSATPASMAS